MEVNAVAAAQFGDAVFEVALLLTPTKGAFLSTEKAKRAHYERDRHYHVPYGQWEPPTGQSLAKDPGARVLVLHQSNRLNPHRPPCPISLSLSPDARETLCPKHTLSSLFSTPRFRPFAPQLHRLALPPLGRAGAAVVRGQGASVARGAGTFRPRFRIALVFERGF